MYISENFRRDVSGKQIISIVTKVARLNEILQGA